MRAGVVTRVRGGDGVYIKFQGKTIFGCGCSSLPTKPEVFETSRLEKIVGFPNQVQLTYRVIMQLARHNAVGTT